MVIAKKLMQVVDQSGASTQINDLLYKSMKEKLDKYESVLFNLVSEIKETEGMVADSPERAMSAARSISPSLHARESIPHEPV